jgi:hypothetical protein
MNPVHIPIFCFDIVAYSLKARIGHSQQPAVIRQRPVNNGGMVFSAHFMPMAEHATMEYVMTSLSNNCTATEERYFYAVRAAEVDSLSAVAVRSW